MSQERRGNIALESLFDTKRVRNQWDLLPLGFYFPLGLCLFIIRIFIGLHVFLVAAILPKASQTRCTIIRSMCAVMGIVVREEDSHLKGQGNVKLLIANHVTPLDFLAVDLTFPCIYPVLCEIPKLLTRTFGLADFGASESREIFLQNLKKYCSSSAEIPVLIHPEGATTNGKKGLLKFNSWPFSLETLIQPICIDVSRPMFDVSPSIIGSTWWSDLFWLLLTPVTIFTLRYMKPMKRNESESVEEWVKRVQTEMAETLKVEATNYTDYDKSEHIKRQAHITRTALESSSTPVTERRPTVLPAASTSSRIEQMVANVKEVLPQVPTQVIRKDLMVTTNVDETITRLLDGTISYQPEVAPSTSSSKQTCEFKVEQSTVGNEPLFFNASAKTFGKTPSERMKSYEERKAALIQNARLRYLRKHPELLKQLSGLQ